MIQTEVKKLGTDEHAVNVQVPQTEYDRVYANHVSKLQAGLKLPGFRPGKTPRGVVEKNFGVKVHEDTVSELVRNYYVEALEKSGLAPAIQPELELPAVQPSTGFRFTLKVVTWPEVKLKKLSRLSMAETIVKVTDADIRSVIDRLMESQVRYETEDDRVAKKGDEVTIDFAGFVDGEAFDGGRGEDSKLVLGNGQFIPGFEDQLEGVKAGEERSLDVNFPVDYQHKPLAGKAARFEVLVKSVGVAVKAANEEELAAILNFDDAGTMREDVHSRLAAEAEQAQFESNRDMALDALLAANEVNVPEKMIKQDMQQTRSRILKSMREQGMDVTPDMFDASEHQEELRKRSRRALSISLLLNAVREANDITVDDDDVEAEIDQQAKQYPDDQQDAFRNWMHGQKDKMESLRDKLLEKKCVACIIEQAKTKPVRMSLEEWQQKRDAAQADSGKAREAA